jgi:hypothetical protein
MNTDFKVKVPGIEFELASNQIYHIREVADADAPDGYQKVGITKHPLPGIEEGIVVPHHELTNTWNTGFWEGSSCLTKEPNGGKEILKSISKNLLPELKYLVDGDLTNGRSNNNIFFDEFIPFNGEGYGEDTSKYKIKGGNMFNTNNPLEFLALWWALIGKQIMPPNQKDSGGYNNCCFVLEDKKQTTSLEQDKEYTKSIAVSTVMALTRNKDKKEINHLQNVFTYVGLNLIIAETSTKPLISSFNKWCEKGGFNNENAESFNTTFEYFEEEDKREELVVFIKLKKDIKDSKVKVERLDIYIEEQNLGADVKSAARKIVADQTLHKAFLLI